MKEDASKMVASALLGIDGKTIIVNSKLYYIKPPTIRILCGASYYLSEIDIGENLAEVLSDASKLENACKALSWFIQGDEKLSDKLMDGTLGEVCDGLETAIELLDIRNFVRLSLSVRNVKGVIAKQK